MISDDFGYVQISKFARTTHIELLNAIAQLLHKQCKGLIIDLRDNTGGFMEAAIRMVNEFLPEGQLIVYAEGRKFPRTQDYANGTGSCQRMPLVVLVDEGAASASEFFAGAIQDNDRGIIVGRRSFGKGLVQQPIDFSDGSAIRLTVARYHTPSGRCIQRPYANGNDSQYDRDWLTRYEHGEFFSKDSIKLNENELFETTLGRPVYGGGGIMPDIFVPQDTTGVSSYLTAFEQYEPLLKHLKGQNVLEQFIRYAEGKGLKRRNLLIQKSRKLIERHVYGNIIYNMLGQEEYIRYINTEDATVKKALEILEKGEAFPTAPSIIEEKEDEQADQKRTAQADGCVKGYVPECRTADYALC